MNTDAHGREEHAFARPADADLFGEEAAVEAEPAEPLAYATPSSYVGGLQRAGKLLVTPRTARAADGLRQNRPNRRRGRGGRRAVGPHRQDLHLVPRADPAERCCCRSGLIILLVLYFTLRKTAGLSFSVRREFVSRRRRVVLLSTLGIFLALGGFALAISLGDATRNSSVLALAVIASALLLIGSAVWAAVGSRLLYPKRITATEARFGGAGEAFLDQVPEVQGV